VLRQAEWDGWGKINSHLVLMGKSEKMRHFQSPKLTSLDDDDDNNNNMKREMSQCYGIKQYTQTEKLQQIGQT
jgi:hypothetical protein